MVKFYRVRHADQVPGTVVIVAEDEGAQMLLRWVPNTGLWHRASDLEPDFLFGDDGGVYDPISAEQAAGLLDKVKRYDTRRLPARRLLAHMKAQPAMEQRTSAELGLSGALTGKRPLSAPGLPALLEKSRQSGRWRTVNIYPAGSSDSSAPRQLASVLNRGSLPDLPAGLRVEAKHAGEGEHVAVKARLRREGKSP